MKTMLLTGASRGLGLTIAQTLLQAGWEVVAVQRSGGAELDSLQQAYPQQLTVKRFDLKQVDQLESIFRDDWFADQRPIGGLVNNAAVAYDDLVSNFDLPPWQTMHSVNLLAPMILTKLAIRRMLLHHTAGSLVHISSVAAHTGLKGLAMYGATKSALEGFSRGVAREWGSRQIRSNCVVPGFMETELSSGLSDDQRQKIYQRTSLQQPTDQQSVAEMVSFLLSDRSRSITGQNMFVDAGSL